MSAAADNVVAVLIATCRRPEGLERLLRAVDEEARRGTGVEVIAVVADNDPEGSAAAGLEALAGQLGIELIHGHEPRRGIPFARNKTMDLARGRARWFLFVDDDEIPVPGWLGRLLATQAETGADVVAAPVVPRFLSPPEPWLIEGGFLEYARHPTGTVLDRAYTGNTLVLAATLERLGLRFDERMDATGGSDTHFFRRLVQAGGKIVWNDEAVAEEIVPATRSDAGWIYQRAFRIGNSSAFIEKDLFGFGTVLKKVVLTGCYRILKGLVSWPIALFRGRVARVRAWRHVAWGAGLLAGLVGFKYREYERLHGS